MTLRDQITSAVEELAAIPFFPREEGAKFAVMRHLEKFVSGPRELRWLVDAAVGAMRKWEGVAELRGLYCTKFSPADGVESDCSLPGFTPADSEQKFFELESAETTRRIETYRKQKLLAAPGEVFDAPELPPVKSIPPARIPAPPVTAIPGTPKRSAEETGRILRDMERRLAERQTSHA